MRLSKTSFVLGAALLSTLACNSSNQHVAPGSNAVEYVGKTVGTTVKGVGETISGAADRVTGDIDVAKAQEEIDQKTRETLYRLFKLDHKAKALFDMSYGYAVFDSRKSSFLISLGGGGGVAVSKKTGNKTYMRMFTGGVNLGAGLQFFQNVFLFETKQSYEKFINSGWEAGSAANANFGRDALDVQVRFIDGMAVFQLAETGINLSVDLTGTKYWKDDALN